jgi:hypothetical protein
VTRGRRGGEGIRAIADGEPEAHLDERPADPLPDRGAWFTGRAGPWVTAERRLRLGAVLAH